MKFKSHFFVFFVLLVLSSCKSKSNLMSFEEVQNDPYLNELKEKGLIQELKLVDEANFVQRDTLFTINEVRQMGHALLVELSYGGGCVEPHVFELVTDGTKDATGAVQLWLLHKTHDDYCKMLISNQITFDISPLQTLKIKNLKSIKVNNISPVDLK